MLRDTGGFAATTPPQDFGLEDFERAGIRVVERRFKPRDVIFTPGDPDDQLYWEVSTRLATLLLNLSERFGENNRAGTILDLRLTHQDLANMIASTREAVSKVMSEFQRDGTIEVQYRKIVLLNREVLAERASGPSGLSIDGQLPI
jgi:CRP-like cAMP-binding protein